MEVVAAISGGLALGFFVLTLLAAAIFFVASDHGENGLAAFGFFGGIVTLVSCILSGCVFIVAKLFS